MTEDDRKAILDFFDRLRAGLAEVDDEADRLIAEQVRLHPATLYTLAQMAFVQEHALAESQNRIRHLEFETRRRQGGFLGGLFGGRGAPPPVTVHAPGYRPGMFESGEGFLGTAARTGMGILGGIMLAQMLASATGRSEPWESSPGERPGGPWGDTGDGRDDVGGGHDADSGSGDPGGGDAGGDS